MCSQPWLVESLVYQVLGQKPSGHKPPGQLPQTNSKILKDPCFIFPVFILKFKIAANMNTYDYP